MVEAGIKSGDRALSTPRQPHDARSRHPPPTPGSGRPRPKPNATPDDLAFGVNACAIAIAHGHARLLEYDRETANPRVLDLARQAAAAGIATREVPLARLDELTAGGVHQGVLVRLRDLPPVDLQSALAAPGHGLAVVLDHVADPQNVGAVLRTAVAVGVRAVILPARRGARLSPGVHRASAGMSFLAPVAAPQNLAQALGRVRDGGFWIVAASGEAGAEDATRFDWPPRTALVLGNEAEGVSQLLLRESDFRVALPMDPRVDSLNVGVAFGALAYLWRRQWPIAPVLDEGSTS